MQNLKRINLFHNYYFTGSSTRISIFPALKSPIGANQSNLSALFVDIYTLHLLHSYMIDHIEGSWPE